MKDNETNLLAKQGFFKDVSNVLENARKNAKTEVNLAMVYAYF